MPSYITIAFLTWLSYTTINWYLCYHRNLQKAKKSGIHYIPVPVFFLHRFWLATHRLYFPLLAKLPDKWTQWVDFCLPDSGHTYSHELFARVGHDTFLTVAPGGLSMFTCEPAVVSAITTRRSDFPKPTSIYVSVNVYGGNVVSAEGQHWRRHRKATSPPFTEKNNQVVWKETLGLAEDMLESWVGKDGKGDMTIDRVADDTMRLSLYVISAAGFGKKMDWPKDEGKGRVDADYADDSKIKNEEAGIDEGHTMSYTYALHCLLDNILFQFLFPRWLLEKLPFKATRKADEAYKEWGMYMKEMVDKKKRDVEKGEGSEQMDIIAQLVKGQMAEKGNPLTDDEIAGNMFVLILAGHETAANSIHFAMLYMALNPRSQKALHKDLDSIFEGRSPSQWDYERDLPALFGGMPGAVMNEELRLVPPVIGIPKSTWGVSDQQLTVDGKSCTVPGGTYISLVTPAAHRNPKYWPHGPPMYPGGKPAHPIANLDNDLEEFRPERWLLENGETQNANGHAMPTENVAGGDLGVNESADTSEKLFKPAKGAYFPFSDGYRSCLGRRFAQVEVLAAIAMIFQNYSVELAVDKYATDEEVLKMDVNEKAEVWHKTAEDARELLLNGMGVIITLQMRKGHVKLRLVPRGKEKFDVDVDDVWKKNHPDECVTEKKEGWKAWKNSKVHVE